MTQRFETLALELWEEADGRTMVCQAGPAGDEARALLEPGARLAWVFEARSHFDAMTQYYERMGWGPYSTNQAWDLEPYPVDWILEQRDALAKEVGNRDVIATRDAYIQLVRLGLSPLWLDHGFVDEQFIENAFESATQRDSFDEHDRIQFYSKFFVDRPAGISDADIDKYLLLLSHEQRPSPRRSHR